MIRLIAIPVFILCSEAVAQNYTFDPGEVYSAVLPMEEYSVHQVNIWHTEADSAHMSWRLIENSCPSEWDIILCDWATCYTGLPLNGEMDPIAPGGHGLIKLTVNPYQLPANGHMLFWIFPSGEQEEYQELLFTFSTVVASVGEPAAVFEWTVFPQPASEHLDIRGLQDQELQLTDATGRTFATWSLGPEPEHRLELPELASGTYYLRSRMGVRRILIH